MFLGEFKHTIDDKGRVTIPAKFRADLADGLVLTRGFDRNLMIYPMAAWDELAAKIMAKSITDKRMRGFRRRVFAAATDLVPDRQGRILLPAGLREFVGIVNDVVIAGMYEYLELWPAEAWETERKLVENPTDSAYWEDLGF